MGPEESYDLLFKKIKESVNKRTLDKQLNSIDLTGRITVGEEVLDFDRIISTINIVDLVELENSGKIRDSIT